MPFAGRRFAGCPEENGGRKPGCPAKATTSWPAAGLIDYVRQELRFLASGENRH
jgi:hypothetical protein